MTGLSPALHRFRPDIDNQSVVWARDLVQAEDQEMIE
jgi:hypothetical protein